MTPSSPEAPAGLRGAGREHYAAGQSWLREEERWFQRGRASEELTPGIAELFTTRPEHVRCIVWASSKSQPRITQRHILIVRQGCQWVPSGQLSWWWQASTYRAVATTLRARLLRIGERPRSKAIRPWALATFYGGVAALFAWLDDWSPWWGLAVAGRRLVVDLDAGADVVVAATPRSGAARMAEGGGGGAALRRPPRTPPTCCYSAWSRAGRSGCASQDGFEKIAPMLECGRNVTGVRMIGLHHITTRSFAMSRDTTGRAAGGRGA